MRMSDLSPEVQERAKACKTIEEFMNLSQEEGFEVSEELLGSVAGGESWNEYVAKECPDFFGCGDKCGIYYRNADCRVNCTWVGGIDPSGNNCDKFEG